MNEHDHFRLLRWLLLLWIGLVSIWGLLGISSAQCSVLGGTSLIMFSKPVTALPTYNALQKGEFLLLMVAHGTLLWAGLAGKLSRRFYWLYFPLQGALVLGASLIIHQMNIALNLYLALTLGAIIMLRQVRAVIAVASGYIVLIILCMLLNFTPWYNGKFSEGMSALNSFWFSLWNTTDAMALTLFVAGYLLLYIQQTRSHTELAATHSQLTEAHSQLKVSAERIEELSRIAERQRLARELHDTLAQGIAGITMQLQVANSHLASRGYERAQQVMQQALKTSREILTSARRAIDDLRTTLPAPEDLLIALHREMRRFTTMTGIPCTTEGLELLSAFPISAREHILRMVGEALNNVAHHAHATHVWIKSEQKGKMLTIEVRDDGCGFDPTAVNVQAGHYGLLGLHERARLVGGAFAVSSAPGQGTRLRLSLPNLDGEKQDE